MGQFDWTAKCVLAPRYPCTIFAKKLTRKKALLNHVKALCSQSQVKSHGPLILPHGNVTITLEFIGSFLEFIGFMAFADYATNFQGTLYLHA